MNAEYAEACPDFPPEFGITDELLNEPYSQTYEQPVQDESPADADTPNAVNQQKNTQSNETDALDQETTKLLHIEYGEDGKELYRVEQRWAELPSTETTRTGKVPYLQVVGDLQRLRYYPGYGDVYKDNNQHGKSQVHEAESPDSVGSPVPQAFRDSPFANKFGLVQAFARRGYGLCIVGQNRSGIDFDPETGKPDATLTRVNDAIAVERAEGSLHTPSPAAGHSYGGFVAARVAEVAHDRGMRFHEGKLVLVSAPGVQKAEGFGIVSRFIGRHFTEDESSHVPMKEEIERIHPTVSQDTSSAGSASIKVNLRRAALEGVEIATQLIDTRKVAPLVEELGILNNGLDTMSSSLRTANAMESVMGDPDAPQNIHLGTPFSTRETADGGILGIRNAHHCDCVLHPERVAAAVVEYLDTPEKNLTRTQEAFAQYQQSGEFEKWVAEPARPLQEKLFPEEPETRQVAHRHLGQAAIHHARESVSEIWEQTKPTALSRTVKGLGLAAASAVFGRGRSKPIGPASNQHSTGELSAAV